MTTAVVSHSGPLQSVDHLDEEIPLVERVRIAGMAVLVSRRLEEGHRGQVVGGKRVEEVVTVILMIGRLRRMGAGDETVGRSLRPRLGAHASDCAWTRSIGTAGDRKPVPPVARAGGNQ